MISAGSSTSNSPRTSTSSVRAGTDTPLLGSKGLTDDSFLQIITQTLCPRIVISSTTLAEQSCCKYGPDNLAHFLEPFGQIEGKVSVRDSQGLPINLNSFYLRFCTVEDIETTDHQKILKIIQQYIVDEMKRRRWTDEIDTFREIAITNNVSELVGVPADSMAPWFLEFRRQVLSYGHIVEYETFDHPLACILVAHSQDENIMEQFPKLYQEVSSRIGELNFMDTNILKYYVLLHDSGKLDDSQEAFELMKKTFGVHCYLLDISQGDGQTEDFAQNASQSENLQSLSKLSNKETSMDSDRPDYDERKLEGEERYPVIPYGPFSFSSEKRIPLFDLSSLKSEPQVFSIDSKRAQLLRAMVRDIAVQSIIPFMERTINQLNDQVASARRGIAGRLFSVGRRYLNQRSPNPSQVNLTSTIKGSLYPATSPEAQMRRLADFSFMIQDYKMAHSIYDTLRKDFGSEKAWNHFAAASCMQTLSALLQPSRIIKSDMVQIHNVGLGIFSNKDSFGAMRTAMVFQLAAQYRRIPAQISSSFSRLLVNARESDYKTLFAMQNALLLEQIAFSSLQTSRPQTRKFAFFQSMAAKFYEDAGLLENAEVCSLFCRSRISKSWESMYAHAAFALCRQKWGLHKEADALASLQDVLVSNASDARTRAFNALLTMDLPASVQPVRFSTSFLVSSRLRCSSALEEDASSVSLDVKFIQVGYRSDVYQQRKPALSLEKPKEAWFPIGETCHLSICLTNPVGCDIILEGINMAYKYNAPNTETKPYLLLAARFPGPLRVEVNSTVNVEFDLTPEHEGEVVFLGFEYIVNSSVRIFEEYNIQHAGVSVHPHYPSLKITSTDQKMQVLNDESHHEEAYAIGDIHKTLEVKAEIPVRLQMSIANAIITYPRLVGVMVKLENTSSQDSIRFSLELTDSKTHSTSTSHIEWIGVITFEGTLAPKEENNLEACLLVSRAGCYDLNQWRVSYSMHHEEVGVERASFSSVYQASSPQFVHF